MLSKVYSVSFLCRMRKEEEQEGEREKPFHLRPFFLLDDREAEEEDPPLPPAPPPPPPPPPCAFACALACAALAAASSAFLLATASGLRFGCLGISSATFKNKVFLSGTSGLIGRPSAPLRATRTRHLILKSAGWEAGSAAAGSWRPQGCAMQSQISGMSGSSQAVEVKFFWVEERER